MKNKNGQMGKTGQKPFYEGPCIPPEMLPERGVTQIKDPLTGTDVLLVNSVMFTAYMYSQGALSEAFFLPLRDRAVIMGAQCPTCGTINCPPFQRMCPDCDFVEMVPVELPDTGIMMASPPISFFTPSMFKHLAPLARGYVLFGEAQTGLSVWCRTTTGMIRPGIFKKGTQVKVVFNDKRQGLITDICVVPIAELSPELAAKSPLLFSEVNWSALKKPEFEFSSEAEENLRGLFGLEDEIRDSISRSPRAVQNLNGWEVRVQVTTAAGKFGIYIENENIEFVDGSMKDQTFELAVSDPAVFLDWWEGKSLTNLLVEGIMWMSNPSGLETITKMDRIPRSVKRDKEDGSFRKD